jgi:cytochrome c biogenesis protein
VTKDPGVWVVWVGCFLMMAGFYITFFLSHRRVWVRLTEKEGRTLVEIAAASHRDRAGFEKEFEKISQALRDKNRQTANKSEESEKSP